jgi:hypothetical protein
MADVYKNEHEGPLPDMLVEKKLPYFKHPMRTSSLIAVVYVD